MSQDLLAIATGIPSDEQVSSIQANFTGWNVGIRWSLEPPEFFDELNADTCTREGDLPLRAAGVCLRVCEPHEPPGTAREEVEQFVVAIELLARTTGTEFDLYLNGTYAGSVTDAGRDRLVQEGLLDPW